MDCLDVCLARHWRADFASQKAKTQAVVTCKHRVIKALGAAVSNARIGTTINQIEMHKLPC